MSSLTPVPHNFNGQIISQLQEDTLINGVLIPKGYVNATEMCKANKKKIQHYWENKKTEEFFTEYNSVHRNSGERVVITIQGGDSEYQGTWVHFNIALHLATWISPTFTVWAMKTLATVINNDFEALTTEAQEAQAKLQSHWREIRDTGKVVRRSLTDAIKEWYIRNPTGSSRPQHVMYAVTTNKIYQVLWGKTALEIEALFGCERNKSRDFMNAGCLQILERAECRVMEFIDEDNIKPVDAVELANLRKAKIALV